ncbi:MAG TPA: transporter [Steroidobacteraceae bacterium]|nr:transporter [Steroidobacteraceae bacterium]
MRIGVALLCTAWLSVSSAWAQTPVTGHYPPGQSGIRGAATPDAGFVYTNFSRLFNNLQLTDAGGDSVQDLDELRFANISMFALTTDLELFGMRYGALAGVPFSTGNLQPSADDALSDDFGLGDILLTPLSLYGKNDRFDYQVQLTFWTASGHFEPGGTRNRGSGFAALVYSLGGVFYPGGDRGNWSVSAVARIEQNFEQDGSGITPGNDIVVDWGIGKVVTLFQRPVDMGVSGFGAWQISSQTGPAGSADPGRYRYYGAGPEASMPLTKSVSMRVRAQWEFGSRNVVKGNNLWIIFAWRK